MKRIVFALICVASLVSCASEARSSSVNEPTTAMTAETATEPSTETETEYDDEQKGYSFESAEKVISMSDSLLQKIAEESINRTNYDDIELFDISLIDKTDCHEWVSYVVPTSDYADDLNGFIGNHLAAQTDGHENIQGDVSYVVAYNEYSDVKSLFCGENDDYSEYSLRYTLTTKWKNDEDEYLNVSHEAIRFVYPKIILFDDEKYIYTGEMTAEGVRKAMSLFRHIISPSHEIVVYPEVIDLGDCIRFSYYEVGHCGGDYNINDTAFLSRRVYEIDKSSGVISTVTEYEYLREFEIPDTALKYE